MGRDQIKPRTMKNPPKFRRAQGIRKPQPLRKSLRLKALRQSQKHSVAKRNHIEEVQARLSPPASDIPKVCSRKRKRGQGEQDVEQPLSRTQEQPPLKRLQASPSSFIDQEEPPHTPRSDVNEGSIDPLRHWIQTGKWRKEYFEQDNQVIKDFERGKSPEDFEENYWLQGCRIREPYRTMSPYAHLLQFLGRKKSSSSLRRKKPLSNSEVPSDQVSSGNKSSQYNSPEYEIRLEQKGSYMRKSTLRITDTSRDLCRTLLEKEQIIPQDTLFRDDLFDETCESIQARNEAMVVRDISPLICPSAQVLRIYGAKHLNYLFESVNEGWNSMAEFEGALPQPDYSVGFGRSAFTQEQLSKLRPFVGEPGHKLMTYFMATTRIYFPFLTCEVKCGAAALDVADRQNAHSMSMALRALVILFRWVGREKELDREILALSISHDHRSVRIYGHYPVIEENKYSFYRHPIHDFSFSAQDGKEKWTAYKFVKNVYDHHAPKLHKLICSAIDGLPVDINIALSQSGSASQPTPQSSQQSSVGSISREAASQPSFLGSQEITPSTSFTQVNERVSKKPKT